MRKLCLFILSTVLASTVLFSSLSAQAQALVCADLFNDSTEVSRDFLTSDRKGAQRFLELIRRGLIERYANDAEVVSLTELLAQADASRKTQSFDIQWSDVTAKITKEQTENSVLYRVSSLVLSEKKKTIEIGGRPKGLNPGFARILASLVEASRRDVVQNPEIEKVEMWAGVVMNLQLVDLLKKTGFTKKHDPFVAIMNGTARYNDNVTYGNSMGFHDVGPAGMMPTDYRSPMARRIQEETGYDWSLHFQVKR